MKKTEYTNAILKERFRARARLAIAWEQHDGNASPLDLLSQTERNFYNAVEWMCGWDAVKDAKRVLKEYPLTSHLCPYDREERKSFSLWLSYEEWSACRVKLIALRKWGLIDIESSACDNGIYLAITAREEAKFVINHIITEEAF